MLVVDPSKLETKPK